MNENKPNKLNLSSDIIKEIAELTNDNEHTLAILTLAKSLKDFSKQSLNNAQSAYDLHEKIGYLNDEVNEKREEVMLECKMHLSKFYNNGNEVLASF